MAETFGNHYEAVVDQKNQIKEQAEQKPITHAPEAGKTAKRNGDILAALKNHHPVDKILKTYYAEGFSSNKLNNADVSTWLPEIFSKMKDSDPAINLEGISDTHLSILLQNLAKKAPQAWTKPKLLLPTVDCSKEKDNFSTLSDLLADASAKWYDLHLNSIHGKKIAGKYFDEKNKKYWSEVYSTVYSGETIHYQSHVIKSTDYALWEKVLEKSPNKKIAINALESNGSTLLEDPLSGNIILLNNEKGVAEFLDKNNTAQLAALNEKQRDHIQRTAISADIASK